MAPLAREHTERAYGNIQRAYGKIPRAYGKIPRAYGKIARSIPKHTDVAGKDIYNIQKGSNSIWEVCESEYKDSERVIDVPLWSL